MRPNGRINLPDVFVVTSRPQIFVTSETELGAGIVTIWATGMGREDGIDGSIVRMPATRTVSIVEGGSLQQFDVLYSGDAPNLILGLVQINFRLPAAQNVAVVGIALQTAGRISDYVALHTKKQ